MIGSWRNPVKGQELGDNQTDRMRQISATRQVNVRAYNKQATIHPSIQAPGATYVQPISKHCLSLVEKLNYTRSYVNEWISSEASLSHRKETYLSTLLSVEKKIEGVANIAIRSLLIEVLIDSLKEKCEKKMLVLVHQNMLVRIDKAIDACKSLTVTTVHQARNILRNKNVSDKVGRRHLFRWHVEELKYKQQFLPTCIQTKEDVEAYSQWIDNSDCVCREIDQNSEWSTLKSEVPHLEKSRSVLTSRLDKQEGALKKWYTRMMQQKYNQTMSGASVVYRPSVSHMDRNEDAFKHDEDITVVADGLGSCLHSEGASRLVVTNLYDRLKQLVREEGHNPINEKTMYQKLLVACADVGKKMENQVKMTLAMATVALEVRIPDDKGEVHRFLVFVGDCNAVLKRPNKPPILLNPLEFEPFKKNVPEGVQTVGNDELGSRVSCLTVNELEKLNEQYGDNIRDVSMAGGTFSAYPKHTLLAQGCMAMVHVKPREGNTALMSDGVTDRCNTQGISPEAIHQIVVNEWLLRQYRSSGQWQTDFFRVSKIIKMMINREPHRLESINITESMAIQRLKKNLATCLGKEGSDDRMKVAIATVLSVLGWPKTPCVIDEMLRFFKLMNILDGSKVKISTIESCAEYLIKTILAEAFELSKMGYQGIGGKWWDDITYVETDSLPCETPDRTSSTLLVLTDKLVHASTMTETEVIEVLDDIRMEYERGETQVNKGVKDCGDNKTQQFIKGKLRAITQETTHRTIRHAKQGGFGGGLQEFLKHIEEDNPRIANLIPHVYQ